MAELACIYEGPHLEEGDFAEMQGLLEASNLAGSYTLTPPP
jgi:hypothetical protein